MALVKTAESYRKLDAFSSLHALIDLIDLVDLIDLIDLIPLALTKALNKNNTKRGN